MIIWHQLLSPAYPLLLRLCELILSKKLSYSDYPEGKPCPSQPVRDLRPTPDVGLKLGRIDLPDLGTSGRGDPGSGTGWDQGERIPLDHAERNFLPGLYDQGQAFGSE